MNLLIHILLAFLMGRALMLPPTEQRAAVTGSSLDVDLYGSVYVLNAEKATLTLLDRDLMTITVIGQPGWDNGRFDKPAAVWARNGMDIFVADYGNHRIQRFDRAMSFVSSLSTHDSDEPEQRFGFPTDVSLSRLGDLFICDSENQKVVKVNRLNKVEKSFGGFDAGKGRLNSPTRLEIGPSDQVYVLDAPRVLVFDTFGNFLREMYQGVFVHPTEICADNERVMVLDGRRLYCFDADERPLGVRDVDSLERGPTRPATTFVAANGMLYFLNANGLYRLPDPFLKQEDRVDKEGKSP